MNYFKKADDFCKKHGVKFKAEYIEHDFYFDDDKDCRDIYRITLKRNKKQYSFKFGQSLMDSALGIEPEIYDVLSCITKYKIESFENFCSEYGYLIDSKKAEKIYKKVCNEYKNVMRLFSDIIEELREIN
jgi:hypothetical protein